jgi:flagellar basal body-associated protein FliL
MLDTYMLISIVVVVLAAIAALCYYVYRKTSSQQETIDQLIQRYQNVESLLNKPSASQELEPLFNQTQECDACVVEPIPGDDSKTEL